MSSLDTNSQDQNRSAHAHAMFFLHAPKHKTTSPQRTQSKRCAQIANTAKAPQVPKQPSDAQSMSRHLSPSQYHKSHNHAIVTHKFARCHVRFSYKAKTQSKQHPTYTRSITETKTNLHMPMPFSYKPPNTKQAVPKEHTGARCHHAQGIANTPKQPSDAQSAKITCRHHLWTHFAEQILQKKHDDTIVEHHSTKCSVVFPQTYKHKANNTKHTQSPHCPTCPHAQRTTTHRNPTCHPCTNHLIILCTPNKKPTISGYTNAKIPKTQK